ncbi:hypothetical protein OO012_04055 [Rhodobacteraceae bacterium KMM 6894]|nr:hypothetical protein [Rhodobacteraceae bacterium KMM 6894]
MTRFATLTAALALAAAPVLADTATQSINQPGAENYQEKPISPDFSYYSAASLIGSDVYTTNRGRTVMDIDGVDMASVSKIGDVSDVQMTNDGALRGIVVDPIDESNESHWYFPASEVITVNDADGPRYMVGYTDDEMGDAEVVSAPETGR